jgi:serine/threonine-protein kinase SRPK3
MSTTSGEIYSQEEKDFAGEIFDERYVIIYKIGKGSFSTVWLSYNIKDKRFYAIKVQNGEFYEEGEMEVEILNKIKQLQYVDRKLFQITKETFIENFDGDEHMCMVSELMIGSLYDIMSKGEFSGGMPVDFCTRAIYKILKSNEILNKKIKIIHTDIKPDNILLKGTNTKHTDIMNEFKTLIGQKKFKKKGIDYQKITDIINNKFSNIDSFSSTDDSEIENTFTESDVESDDESVAHAKFKIDKKFISNADVKLNDFGTSLKYDKGQISDIQTRYYRAPEIMLGYPHDERCDVWALGCTFYEILTGKILFDPDKKRNLCRDRCHLLEIISGIDLMPEAMVKDGTRSKNFFKKNGILKGIQTIKFYSLQEKITKDFINIGIDKTESENISDFILRTLTLDPNLRPTFTNLINHKIFNTIN